MCAGISSLVFLFVVGLGEYAVALAFVVALLDVIPMIGATIGAVVVTAIGFADRPEDRARLPDLLRGLPAGRELRDLPAGDVALVLAGLVGLVPMTASTAAVSYDGARVPFWLPLLGLGVITAALAYTTGIAAGRRLGSRLASFAALLEVVAALLFAWLLLGELPQAVQFAGGALILVGVVVVKLGERGTVADPEGVITPV